MTRLGFTEGVLAGVGLTVLMAMITHGCSEATAQPRALERGDGTAARVASANRLGAAVPTLESALYLRLCLPSGREMRHCRSHAGGCHGYAHDVALEMRTAAAAWSIDPWLLASLAVRESSLRSDAIGSAGETGRYQLHPRSPAGIEARRRCAAAPDECDAAQADLAAELLARSIQLCGSEAAALGRYSRGRCGETPYSRSVLRIRDALRGGA